MSEYKGPPLKARFVGGATVEYYRKAFDRVEIGIELRKACHDPATADLMLAEIKRRIAAALNDPPAKRGR